MWAVSIQKYRCQNQPGSGFSSSTSIKPPTRRRVDLLASSLLLSLRRNSNHTKPNLLAFLLRIFRAAFSASSFDLKGFDID
jgi:hypothetical protein